MSRKRIEARAARRHRQALRWELVHAVGCMWRGEASMCATVQAAAENVADARKLGVRIPRTLRALEREAWAEARKRGLA